MRPLLRRRAARVDPAPVDPSGSDPARRGVAADPAGPDPTGAPVELTEQDRHVVWRVAAFLLDYPGAQPPGLAARLRAAAGTLPAPAGPALVAFLDHADATDPGVLARHYVETFDMKRRHCLHLTYYAYGDTRKRGMALLRFKHAYKIAGAELGDHELPDHLTVVLEFAATVDPVVGRRLLVEYLPVVELLRRGLGEIGSPYAGVLDAVVATLPDLGTADRRRVAELAAQGPPSEEVGLDDPGIEPLAMDPALLDGYGMAGSGMAGSGMDGSGHENGARR